MLNGITYMVRPRIAPVVILVNVARISSGATQLLLGPASSSLALHTKVRSSMRATSSGSERARKQPGRFFSFNRISMPEATISLHKRSYSSFDPSHHTMRSGWVILATSATHAFNFSCWT